MFSLRDKPSVGMKLIKLGCIILGEGSTENDILIGAISLTRGGLNAGAG